MLNRYLLPSFAMLFSACTLQQPIKNVEPVSTAGMWKNGIQYVESTQPSSVVLVGFLHYDNDGYVFDAVITNNGNQPILFEPNKIQCSELDESNQALRTLNAIDPETKITQVTKDLQFEEEEPIGFALLQIAGTTVDLFDGPDTPEEREERKEREQAEAAQEDRIARLRREKEKYTQELIRKHQLNAGEVVSGKLICPKFQSNTATLQLQIPIGTINHEVAWHISPKES